MAKARKPRQDAGESPQTAAAPDAEGERLEDEAGTETLGGADCGDPSGAPSLTGAAGQTAELDGASDSQPVDVVFTVSVAPPAPSEPAPRGAPERHRYRPKHPTLSAEVSELAREAFQAREFAAHGELHQVSMAVAHLRHAMVIAKGRLKGERRALLEQLLEGL